MKNINHRLSALCIAAASLCAPAVSAADGITIDHLGVNNTLVRVNGPERYLLIPVQDSADDARIEVLVDGKVKALGKRPEKMHNSTGIKRGILKYFT